MLERVSILIPGRATLEIETGFEPWGACAAMADAREFIRCLADTDVPVLLQGEPGTGKELAAQAIHATSPRRGRPLVQVDCSGPAELLSSELFGFERGAFPGALAPKPGKLEFANQGTIFLREVDQLPASLQRRLGQVLEDGVFANLGGAGDFLANVRVIAAASRNLEEAMADGQFCRRLFLQLNVVSLTLPPLRERPWDVRALTHYFLFRYSELYNKVPIGLAPATLRAFDTYDWPGNVTELKSLVKRIVLLGTDIPICRDVAQSIAEKHRQRAGGGQTARTAPIEPVAVDGPPSPSLPGPASLKAIGRSAARDAERELIGRTLEQTRWNRRTTAAILGVSYKALLYKIKDAGLGRAS